MSGEYSIPENVKCTKEYIVGKEHTASHIGSGEVEVLSTPSMIAFMEHTCLECVQRYLGERYTTVGTRVDVHHMKPAPIGAHIRVEAELVERSGRKLVFNVKAYWDNILIGEGVHERYIVDKEKFIKKVKELVSGKEK